MFYAEFFPCGIGNLSIDDSLMAFKTKKERAEMVHRINMAHDCLNPVCVEVTTREIAHRYDLRDFKNDKSDEVLGVRTCANRPFLEIKHRPNYRF